MSGGEPPTTPWTARSSSSASSPRRPSPRQRSTRPVGPPGIEDPRLVRVLDVGTDGDLAFVVEEPLSGAMPLSHILHTGGLPAEEVRRIVGETASASRRPVTRTAPPHAHALVDPAHA